MTVYAAPIEVLQAAFARTGISPITSLSDPGRRATTANTFYEPKVRELLTRHAWSFATAWIALTYQGEQSAGRYRYAYDEPVTNPAKLNNRAVYYAGDTSAFSDWTRKRPVDFALYNGTILSDLKCESEELVLEYTFRASEGDWSADFAEAVVKFCAAHFALALKQDPQLATLIEGEAQVALRRAIAREREQAPRPQNYDDQLIRAWINGERRR